LREEKGHAYPCRCNHRCDWRGRPGRIGPRGRYDIKTFLSGQTTYLETTAASSTGKPGQGVIYWAADGTVLYKTPTGAMWHGKWEIKGNTACTDWKEKPNNPCVRYDKTGDTVSVLDAVGGQTRAKVVKTAPSNAEKLAP
jgi:hypothetical protein